MASHSRSLFATALVVLALVSVAACDSSTATPVVTTVSVTLKAATIMTGQTDSASAATVDQKGAPITAGAVTWSSQSTAIATVDSLGVVTGVAAGTTQIIATVAGKSGQTPVNVVAPAGIKVNEVESSGGVPGDWAEFYNPTNAPVDLSGWVVKDNDDTHIYRIPAGTTIGAGGYYVAEEAGFGFGLGAPDAVRLYSPFGTLVDSYDWTAHAATTYGRCPNGTGTFTTTTTVTKGTANDCSTPNNVKINEVESSGGTPGDWVELYNAGTNTVDLSGFVFRDNDDTHTYTIPAGTTLAPGAYMTLEEAQFVFGLGAPDAARLFKPDGVTLVDSYSWDTHAATTYGRCPNGTGAFTTTVASTKGAVNSCTAGTTIATWPGTDNVATADGNAVFGGNLSGLMYEAAAGGAPAVLWGARNGVGSLFRLIFSGGIWTPDPANGWGTGKALHYPDGTGDPDAEDVTYAGTGSVGGLFVATERNNSNNGVSKLSVLRFDPSAAGTSLTATNEWNLTADIPAVGANLGLEAITWIPDTYLTGQGFFDATAGHAYNPAEYANHGTGLFFVGVEATGTIYAYALNQTANTFTRIATITAPFTAGVMSLNFDRELNYLWAECDDGCGGLTATLEIDVGATSPTKGKFVVTHQFARPTTMPNYNNEGFAMASQSTCVGGFKAVWWADDTEDGGHAIRTATLPCTRFP